MRIGLNLWRNGGLLEIGRHWKAFAVLFLLCGCEGGFYYEQLTSQHYAATDQVDWLTREPARPYVILSKFRGSEMSLCAKSEPNCSLIEEAKRVGAEAVWVQQTSSWVRPEQWLNLNGQWTRIPPQTYHTLEGVLIRYK